MPEDDIVLGLDNGDGQSCGTGEEELEGGHSCTSCRRVYEYAPLSDEAAACGSVGFCNAKAKAETQSRGTVALEHSPSAY